MQKYFDKFLLRLKELQGGESVSAFARRLGMPQNTLDCYMRGARKPSVELLTRVCDNRGVSADWLLGRDSAAGVPRAPFAIQSPARSQGIKLDREDPGRDLLRGEIAELRRRIDALEKAQSRPSFACA